MKVIDTHAHIFPGDFGPPPEGCDPGAWPSTEPNPDLDGGKFLVNGPMRIPAAAVWFDAERRLEASAERGVGVERLFRRDALVVCGEHVAVGGVVERVANEYIEGRV